ncbi:ABC transporter E family member [Trifolium repens]|nr:ABC transporter E family member [Trifolium repens]
MGLSNLLLQRIMLRRRHSMEEQTTGLSNVKEERKEISDHLLLQWPIQVVNLSLGECQRVELCLCLGKPADIYLIDEPIAYLDPQLRMAVVKAIKGFIHHANKTAFLVEPDLEKPEHFADRVILFQGTPTLHCSADIPQYFFWDLSDEQWLKQRSIPEGKIMRNTLYSYDLCLEVLIYIGLNPVDKYMDNYVSVISERVKYDILGKDSGTSGKQLIEASSDVDQEASFVMFKSGDGEDIAVQMDDNQTNQEEQLKKLAQDRVKEIQLIAEKVTSHLETSEVAVS